MRSTLPVAAATKRMEGCWHRRSAISSMRERSILSPMITGDSKPTWNGSTAATICTTSSLSSRRSLRRAVTSLTPSSRARAWVVIRPLVCNRAIISRSTRSRSTRPSLGAGLGAPTLIGCTALCGRLGRSCSRCQCIAEGPQVVGQVLRLLEPGVRPRSGKDIHGQHRPRRRHARPQRVDDRDAETVLETAGEGVESEAHAPEQDCLGALLEQPAADRGQPPQRVLGVRDQLVELETDGVYADASRADLEA